MELKFGEGITLTCNVAALSDEDVKQLAQEVSEVVQARGLELPQAVGATALESTVDAVDTVELSKADVKESIFKQLSAAHQAHDEVLSAINGKRRGKNVLPAVAAETLAAELSSWLSQDKLDYVTAAQEADPDLRFTLVATPNVAASTQEIKQAAQQFGKDQPYRTYIWDQAYDSLDAAQLAGTDPSDGKSVKFSLIPSKLDDNMTGTVAEQRAQLAKAQVVNPDLQVPSVLDAITHWETLRAQDVELAGGEAFDRTYIRHFDLPEQRLDGWSGVPFSYVCVVGGPGLDRSNAEARYGARVAVGQKLKPSSSI